MTAFTILGILTYWWLMGCVGYVLGYGLRLLLDMQQGIKRVTAEVDSSIAEIDVLVAWMTAYGAKGAHA